MMMMMIPQTPKSAGRGIPIPIPHPLDAFGVSVSAPMVPLSDGLDTRPCKILDPPLDKAQSRIAWCLSTGRSLIAALLLTIFRAQVEKSVGFVCVCVYVRPMSHLRFYRAILSRNFIP